MDILTVNLVFTTVVFWIGARLYLSPRLHQLSPRDVLLPILLLHSMRHLGLMFLAPGAVYAGIPQEFAIPAAAGDLVAALLAVVAIPAVAGGAWIAKPLVWLFNVEGTVDLEARSSWRPYSARARTWDPLTGFPRSGFPRCS